MAGTAKLTTSKSGSCHRERSRHLLRRRFNQGKFALVRHRPHDGQDAGSSIPSTFIGGRYNGCQHLSMLVTRYIFVVTITEQSSPFIKTHPPKLSISANV